MLEKLQGLKMEMLDIQISERKDLVKKDNIDFEDCLVFIDYNVMNKKKALKYVFDNILKMIKIDSLKNLDTNKIPYNYDKFFCENLCSFYKFCSVGV